MTCDSLWKTLALGQFFTPAWAAELLVEQHFADLTLCDTVLEPSCGPGAFLGAIPDHVPAVGVEIDPDLAARAQANTGRPVVVGDFLSVDIPMRPTAIVGNPPFKLPTIEAFLRRAQDLLPDGGRCGLILPAYTFQTARTACRIARGWRIDQQMLPRDLFPRLRLPLCFAIFRKASHGELVSFALYHEAVAVARMQARYRALLAAGERSAWRAVTAAALESLGGVATLPDLYAEIEGHQPTPNRWWREKVRQQLQGIAVRLDRGRWALPARAAA